MVKMFGKNSEEYFDLQMNSVFFNEEIYSGLQLFNYFLNKNAVQNGYYQELDTSKIPSLAGVYLTNYLKLHKLNVEFVGVFNQEKEYFRNLLEQNPLTIAITTTLYTDYFPVQEIVDFIHQYNTQTKIIVGGPLIANYFQGNELDDQHITLKSIGADFYVNEAQGEKTLLRIIKALKLGKNLMEVPNIVFWESEDFVKTLNEIENNNLDHYYINWRMFSEETVGTYVLTRTGRGCPYSCNFCSYPVNAKRYSLASIRTVEKELQQLDQFYRLKYVSFVDDTFNTPKDRFKHLLKMLIDNQFSFQWFCYCRAHLLDKEIVGLMKQAGCYGVFLGLESGSDYVLKNINKNATRQDYLHGIQLLRQADIFTFGSFIVGFPGETEETIQETIDFINEANLDYYRAELFYYDQRTPIAHRKDEFGLEGRSYKWSHNTMNSVQASQQVERIFRECTNAIWMPKHDLNFFNLPYLLSNGFDLELFTKYLQYINQMIRDHLDKKWDYSEIVAQLEHLIEDYRARNSERLEINNPNYLQEKKIFMNFMNEF